MALLDSFSSANRTWILKIMADTKDATKGIEDVEKSTKGFSSTAKGVGKAVVAGLATAAVVDFGRRIVTAASDTEQSLGAVQSVFGEFSGEIEKFGQTSAKNIGVSNQEFLQMSALMGSLLKGAGVPLEQVTKQTETLTERAADLSAMFGGTAAEAMDAIGSALKGQFDPLEKFGVSLRMSDIDARAMAQGYVDAAGKVTNAGRAMATQELILERSADAAGTFAKESDTLAGQTQIMQAQFKDLQAQLGAGLLPVIVELMKIVRPFVQFIANNASWLAPVAGIIGGIVLAVKAWTAAQWLLNSALLANPLGLIVIAIGAVVAAIVVLVKNWDTVKEVVGVVTDAVVTAWNWVVDKLKVIAEAIIWWITLPYRTLWETVKYIVGLVTHHWQGFVDNMRYLFGMIYDIITWPFRQAWDLIQYIADGFNSIWRGVLDNLRYAFGQVYDIITYPFKLAMQGVKYLWNSTIGGFGFSIPSWVPLVGGREFRIPKLASGGIVNRPTIAMIGEAGPEAVIPLNGRNSLMGTTVYNVNVYALNANAETGRMINDALREYERTNGKRLAG